MTIDCNIYLPNDTRFDDVCNVIGILLGQKKEKSLLDNNGFYCNVYDVTTNLTEQDYDKKPNIFARSTYSPSYVTIEIKKNLIDKQWHTGNYFFETENNMRLLSGGSNEFWKRIGKGLVDFFGGWIDYNDCDDIDKDFEKEKPRLKNNPSDNEEWDIFQQELLDLLPLKFSK